ncbi:MAG TPA: sensor histidine kinase [Ktedonobacteraceae bacterium]|jgi:signal transduction histidine kinase
MVHRALSKHLRLKISLTAAISILLTLVAIIPLLITITSSQSLSRSQLITQSANSMAQDAHASVQLIDAYLLERLHDVQIVSSLFALQEYMQGDHSPTSRQQALNALSVGEQNDVNYDSWSVLDMQGNAHLWYPIPPRMHGSSLIPTTILDQVNQSTTAVFSGVYYDPVVGNASAVIYIPIITSDSKVVGILRAEFFLNYIWNVVNSQVDTVGSYAFILDQNDVRIAYANTYGSTLARSKYLFTAITPFTPSQQYVVSSQDLYGNNERNLTTFNDRLLASKQNDPHTSSKFDMVPAGQKESFEVVKVPISIVSLSWTYYALRPLKAIVSIADEQLHTTLLIAAIVLVLAILIGITTGRRITEPLLRSMEQEHRAYTQQQYLNQMKDQILLNVSHELRTPLTEVYGYLELLTTFNHQLDSTTQMTFLKHATDGCEELQLLVNDVLDTVRSDNQPRTPHLQNVSVMQIVNRVLANFDPRTVQNFDLQISIPETLVVQADEQYLRQILRNLLSNAFKYTPRQTPLVIDATPSSTRFAGNPPSPSVCIRVKDSGPGIPAADISLLFEKFGRLERDVSSSIRGVGLGLYINKQLVEAMGGEIWVESSGIVGEGSQFCFTLPLAIETTHEKVEHLPPSKV